MTFSALEAYSARQLAYPIEKPTTPPTSPLEAKVERAAMIKFQLPYRNLTKAHEALLGRVKYMSQIGCLRVLKPGERWDIKTQQIENDSDFDSGFDSGFCLVTVRILSRWQRIFVAVKNFFSDHPSESSAQLNNHIRETLILMRQEISSYKSKLAQSHEAFLTSLNEGNMGNAQYHAQQFSQNLKKALELNKCVMDIYEKTAHFTSYTSEEQSLLERPESIWEFGKTLLQAATCFLLTKSTPLPVEVMQELLVVANLDPHRLAQFLYELGAAQNSLLPEKPPEPLPKPVSDPAESVPQANRWAFKGYTTNRLGQHTGSRTVVLG